MKNDTSTPYVSILLGTYTGIELIDRCLTSIREQTYFPEKMELVVVIDGPNQELCDRIESFRSTYDERGISFTVHMFEQNQGRFAAQKKAAELSEGDFLIFMGDRISIPKTYVADIVNMNHDAVIPDVNELGWEKNLINTFIHLVRRKVFSRKAHSTQKTFIDKDNFEKTPKGNGGMLISKELYLAACDDMNVDVNDKHVSDDTRMLRAVVDRDVKILRTTDVCIDYEPRTTFSAQASHLYQRGPRFVNYYIHRGTRFNKILIALLLLPFLALSSIVAFKIPFAYVVVAGVSGVVLLSALLSQTAIHFFKLLVAIPVVATIFYAGLYKGFFIYLAHQRSGKLKKVVSFVVFAISIGVFVWYVSTHWEQFALLGEIRFGFLIILVAANVASLMINGVFMKIVLEPFNIKLSLRESFFVSLISSAGNFFAPGGTGIGIRGVYLKKKHGLKYSDFLTTVAGNYVIVFFVVSVTGLTSLLMLGWRNDESYLILIMIFGALLVLDLALMSSKFSKGVKRVFLSMSDRVPGKSILIRIFDGWDLIVSNSKVLTQLIILAAVGYGVSLATGLSIVWALQIDISFAGLMLLVALSSISIFINITPGNIGIKEAVLVYSAQLIGISTAEVLAFSIIDRSVLFLVLFFGWIVLHTLKTKDQLKELETDYEELEEVSP
jgi:uncharacterized protein (TIRG00374 family)